MTEEYLAEVERRAQNLSDIGPETGLKLIAEVRRLQELRSANRILVEELNKSDTEVIGLRAALRQYAWGIVQAISNEEGLDGAEGERLLRLTEEGRQLERRLAEVPEETADPGFEAWVKQWLLGAEREEEG